MTTHSIEQIVKLTNLSPTLVDALVIGATKMKLHDVLADLLEEPIDNPAVDVARMNAVGTLRSVGYVVSGGRAGGKIYQITGFEKKPTYQTADQWTSDRREILNEFEDLPDISFPRVRLELFKHARRNQLTHATAYHEMSSMYLNCYEMARDRGRYVRGASGACIVLKRFESMPRFRIFNLSMTDPGEILDLVKRYSRVSLSTVRVLNVLSTLADDLIFINTGSAEFRREAVYRTRRIAEHPDEVFNKRAMTTLRKLDREMTWDRAKPYAHRADHMTTIVQRWRAANEKKQRQLAITRDKVAIETFAQFPESFTFVGYREGEPVCLHILDSIPGVPDTVAQIVEKSINYRSQPGGTYGVADYNLFRTCQFLVALGIEFLNAGAFEGGGQGLPQHKERFCLSEDIVKHITYVPTQSHLDRKELIVT